MYCPVDLIQKFVDADITNQELIDGSIVTVDDARVKVNLTNFSK